MVEYKDHCSSIELMVQGFDEIKDRCHWLNDHTLAAPGCEKRWIQLLHVLDAGTDIVH